MLTAQILEAFSQRISWSTMRVILKMCDLPVGRGWEQTIKKITDEEVAKIETFLTPAKVFYVTEEIE